MASMLQNRRPSFRLGTPGRPPAGAPLGSPAPWFDDHQPLALSTIHRFSLDYTGATAGRRSPAVRRGARDLSGFSTPSRVTLMGREHDLAQFRTPQHPASGTNNWGGASPLLSTNIPRKSLDVSYLKFSSLADDEGECGCGPGSDLGTLLGTPVQIEGYKRDGDVKRRKRGWFVNKFGWSKKEEEKEEVYFGTVEKKKKKKSSWMRRWPQGW